MMDQEPDWAFGSANQYWASKLHYLFIFCEMYK